MSHDKKKNLGKVVAVVAGAVVAGAVALRDKKNRQKIRKAFSAAQGLVKGYMGKARDQAEEGKAIIKNKATKAIKQAEKVTEVAKKKVRKL
jgi:hypothetical protein